MIKRGPFAVHQLTDCGRDVALVRYDGDPDVFAALAQEWLSLGYTLTDRPIEAPQPQLYRINPCNSDDYGWTLGRPSKPGRGVFIGAVITLARPAEELGRPAPYGCWRCEAKPRERHLISCLENSGVHQMVTGTSVEWNGRTVWLTNPRLSKPWVNNDTGSRYTHNDVARMIATGAARVRSPHQSHRQEAAAST